MRVSWPQSATTEKNDIALKMMASEPKLAGSMDREASANMVKPSTDAGELEGEGRRASLQHRAFQKIPRDLLNHVAFVDGYRGGRSRHCIGRQATESDYLQVLRLGEGPIAILVYAHAARPWVVQRACSRTAVASCRAAGAWPAWCGERARAAVRPMPRRCRWPAGKTALLPERCRSPSRSGPRMRRRQRADRGTAGTAPIISRPAKPVWPEG